MKIKRIEHIAIAVENLDGMAALMRDKFGIAVEYAEDRAGSATKLAMLPVGESYIELLQGLAPASRTAEWIADRGAPGAKAGHDRDLTGAAAVAALAVAVLSSGCNSGFSTFRNCTAKALVKSKSAASLPGT